MSTPQPGKDELLARAGKPSEEALRLHPFYRGKMQTTPKCAIRGFEDFAIWYSPGVAAPCRAIQNDPDLVFAHTNKANSIAIVTDGTRVLGLGDIGPEAGLPVMEGKAMLFNYLGGVDAVSICLATKDPDEIIRTVRLLEPAFGGINLEDISQPKCFRILDELRGQMGIPVWHDDQQGTATSLLAGLLTALSIVGKDLRHVRLVMVSMGAANVASYRLLTANGADPRAIIACDSKGTLHKGRHDIEEQQARFADKWRACIESNADGVTGGIAEALRGAEVCIAFSASGPGIIRPEWIKAMAPNAIVFACANPVPEIWPWEAKDAGARIVATGRGDFPNQLNNSPSSPGSSAALSTCAPVASPTAWRPPSHASWPASPRSVESTATTSSRAWMSGTPSRGWRPRPGWPPRRTESRGSSSASRSSRRTRPSSCAKPVRPRACSCARG